MCRGYSFCQLVCVCPHVVCFSVFAGAVCLSVYKTFVCLFESLSLSLLMCVSVCAYVYAVFSMCICERVSVFLFAEVCVAVSWRKS